MDLHHANHAVFRTRRDDILRKRHHGLDRCRVPSRRCQPEKRGTESDAPHDPIHGILPSLLPFKNAQHAKLRPDDMLGASISPESD